VKRTLGVSCSGTQLRAWIACDWLNMNGALPFAVRFAGIHCSPLAAGVERYVIRTLGACAAAICTPPLGLALATLIERRLWTEEQKESGLAALGMGMVGITEGAIPFAAADPMRVIPSIMFGSMVAASIAMLGGVGDHAPHGGPIVLPVVDHRLVYVVAIVVGAMVTAFTINILKRSTERPAVAREGVSP